MCYFLSQNVIYFMHDDTHAHTLTQCCKKNGKIIRRYEDIFMQFAIYGNWNDSRKCMTHMRPRSDIQCVCLYCVWIIYIAHLVLASYFLFIRPKFIVYTLIFIEMRQSRHGESHISHKFRIQCAYLRYLWVSVCVLTCNAPRHCKQYKWTLRHTNIIEGKIKMKQWRWRWRRQQSGLNYSLRKQKFKWQFSLSRKLKLMWLCVRRWHLLRLLFIIVWFALFFFLFHFCFISVLMLMLLCIFFSSRCFLLLFCIFSLGNLLQTFQYIYIFSLFLLSLTGCNGLRNRVWNEFSHTLYTIRISVFVIVVAFLCSVRVPILHSIRWLWGFLRIAHFQRKLMCVILKRANDVRFQNDDVVVDAAVAVVVVHT